MSPESKHSMNTTLFVHSTTEYNHTNFFSTPLSGTVADIDERHDPQRNILEETFSNLNGWDTTEWVIISVIVGALICIFILFIGLCYYCNKRRCNNPKQHSLPVHNHQDPLPVNNVVNHQQQYQPVPTDIDTDVEIDPANEQFNQTTLSIETDTIVVQICPNSSTKPTVQLPENITEEKESELRDRTISDSSTNSSVLYESVDTTPTGSSNNEALVHVPPGNHVPSTLYINGALSAAQMTVDAPLNHPHNYLCSRLCYVPTLPSSSTAGHFASNGITPALPESDEFETQWDEGESKVQEPSKKSWDEQKVANWIGKRGKMYEKYVQSCLDHGINGRLLCQYEGDGTELKNVFGLVVSNKHHRDKLTGDWIALP